MASSLIYGPFFSFFFFFWGGGGGGGGVGALNKRPALSLEEPRRGQDFGGVTGVTPQEPSILGTLAGVVLIEAPTLIGYAR